MDGGGGCYWGFFLFFFNCYNSHTLNPTFSQCTFSSSVLYIFAKWCTSKKRYTHSVTPHSPCLPVTGGHFLSDSVEWPILDISVD